MVKNAEVICDCPKAALGACSQAIILDGQTRYFNDPKLAKHFSETGFEQTTHEFEALLPGCRLPNLLKEAVERARARKMAYYHPE